MYKYFVKEIPEFPFPVKVKKLKDGYELHLDYYTDRFQPLFKRINKNDIMNNENYLQQAKKFCFDSGGTKHWVEDNIGSFYGPAKKLVEKLSHKYLDWEFSLTDEGVIYDFYSTQIYKYPFVFAPTGKRLFGIEYSKLRFTYLSSQFYELEKVDAVKLVRRPLLSRSLGIYVGIYEDPDTKEFSIINIDKLIESNLLILLKPEYKLEFDKVVNNIRYTLEKYFTEVFQELIKLDDEVMENSFKDCLEHCIDDVLLYNDLNSLTFVPNKKMILRR